jgi:CheY-like chemotaxis protein
LAGGVAHDFNNLLTGIMGITDDILKTLPAADPRGGDLREVMSASRRAGELTKQLLAFGRRQISAPKVLNLNQVVSDMNRLLTGLLGEDVRIHLGLDPALGAVRIDQTQLEQVIVNLMLNARDAMKGGGDISIETGNIELGQDYAKRHAEVQPGPYVLLSISDDGEGMDDETLSHIFEPFFTTKAQGMGSGLGLATVYGIVKQHGGDIAVSSHQGRGTTFRIYLPRVREPVEAVAAPSSPLPVLERGSGTILLVEDEALVRRVTAKPLRARGYQVLEAASPGEALQIAAAVPDSIDLLLTDVVMPGMSGPELAEALRSRLAGIPVLYMSAHPPDLMQADGRLGADIEFIQKSFTPDVLCEKVRRVLAAHRARTG